MNKQNADRKRIETIEIKISNYLKFGVFLSAAVILTGLVMSWVEKRSGYPGDTFPVTVPTIFQGFMTLKPYAIVLTGLLLLILTPVFRVAVSILTFLEERDYLYAVITSIVLSILIIGFLLGKIA